MERNESKSVPCSIRQKRRVPTESTNAAVMQICITAAFWLSVGTRLFWRIEHGTLFDSFRSIFQECRLRWSVFGSSPDNGCIEPLHCHLHYGQRGHSRCVI